MWFSKVLLSWFLDIDSSGNAAIPNEPVDLFTHNYLLSCPLYPKISLDRRQARIKDYVGEISTFIRGQDEIGSLKSDLTTSVISNRHTVLRIIRDLNAVDPE